MSRFSMQFVNKDKYNRILTTPDYLGITSKVEKEIETAKTNLHKKVRSVKSNLEKYKTSDKTPYFNKDMTYYICSSGGAGSTIIFNYLSMFGNVFHIHDRYPPNQLQYVGKENTIEDIYSEWFNNVDIPEHKLKNFKVIFIYRHPIQVIFSRCVQRNGPNIAHLQHIKCANNGKINFFDVIKSQQDLYGLEDFFDNYVAPKKRNYDIYCVKYELFWNNISFFNKTLDIPDVKELYPVKFERPKRFSYVQELNFIYKSLINKMNRMRFIEIIKPLKQEEYIEPTEAEKQELYKKELSRK